MIVQDYYIPGVYLDDKRLNFSWIKGMPRAEVFVLPANVRPRSAAETESAVSGLRPFAVLRSGSALPLDLRGVPANVNLLVLPSMPGPGGNPRRVPQCDGKNILLSFDGMRTQIIFAVTETYEAMPGLVNKLRNSTKVTGCNLAISSPVPLEKGAIMLQVGDVYLPLPAVDGILRLQNLPFTARRQVRPVFFHEEDQKRYELMPGVINS